MAMKPIAAILAVFALLFTLPTTHSKAAANGPLDNVKSYKIYYGQGSNSAVAALSKYNMVIIEPYAFTKDQIAKLKQAGTKVLGYVSVMELEEQNKANVTNSDYYYYNNEKMEIPQWNTYIMDITSVHYRSTLMKKVNEQVVQKGLDGVFLDTVGDIDDYFYDKPQDQTKVRDGYVDFLKQIKAANPKLVIMQNWGFETIQNASLPYVDAVLWEDFNSKIINKDQWSKNWIKYFQGQQGKLKVFTVAPNTASQNFSLTKGFVSLVNKNDVYDKLK